MHCKSLCMRFHLMLAMKINLKPYILSLPAALVEQAHRRHHPYTHSSLRRCLSSFPPWSFSAEAGVLAQKVLWHLQVYNKKIFIFRISSLFVKIVVDSSKTSESQFPPVEIFRLSPSFISCSSDPKKSIFCKWNKCDCLK